MRLSKFPVYCVILLTVVLRSEVALAQDKSSVLAQCRGQTLDLDEIHNCLDNSLDILDGNIDTIMDFLEGTLSGSAQRGLALSQNAFVEFRRQNCLWYLDFSSPRGEAEQIAKNCLATMSQQRLAELQALVSSDIPADKPVTGFYVYGADRNSFQPCGSDARYWVEGDLTAVGLMQQTYLSIATSDRQVLHAAFVGTIDKDLQAPVEHQGIFQLKNMIELRVPTETDCQWPANPANVFSTLSATNLDDSLQRETADGDEPVDQDEPQQQLTAYFGDWLVDCIEISQRKSCQLEVALLENQKPTPVELQSRLIINRTPASSSYFELIFPGREIDNPARIRWRVDAAVYGDIIDSEIRVDEIATRQIVPESKFLTTELMPTMMKGNTIVIDVLDSVDDVSGIVFAATLKGLTRALAFADDFVRDNV